MGNRSRLRRRSPLSLCAICLALVGSAALLDAFVLADGRRRQTMWLRNPHAIRRQQMCEQTAAGIRPSRRTDVYQLLQPREHVLRRPDMYIGPVEPRNESIWIIEESKVVETNLMLSPGFVQIYNEILVNAIDRQFHSDLSEIRIDIDSEDGNITLWNDGGAIPVEIHPDFGIYVPNMVFSKFMSGENFDDTGVRFTGGRNGIGAKATNVFSKAFEVTVEDPRVGLQFFQRWENNMASMSEPVISELSPSVQKGSVKVSFIPDLPRFGLKRLNDAHLKVMKSRAFDAAACTGSQVQVSYNNEVLRVQNFQEYATNVLGNDVAVMKVHDMTGRNRAEVAVAFRATGGFSALGFVNGIRCSRGTHVKHVTDQITKGIINLAAGGLVDATVRQYLQIVINVLVDNPDFDSQTKTRLTTTTSKLGFDLVVSDDFIHKVGELGVLEAALNAKEVSRNRVLQRALASGAAPSIAKLEDAIYAGRKGRNCTLILTEGDSAKALAVAGLARVGRETYGVFPLKGKPLNVRTATDKQMMDNQELKHLMHILGLHWGQTFKSEEEVMALRYQQLMVFSDQDLDGHHIAGLIINLFVALWPSLLEVKPDFIRRFATPLVKVFAAGGEERLEFFTQRDFELWQAKEESWTRRYRAKYYKGLGTSTRGEALEYFSNMDKHIINVDFEGEDAVEAVEKAFEPTRADDRKEWITGYDPTEEVDYSQSAISFKDFFQKSFVHFSAHDCVRSIPLLTDGLKPSQRKVLWWAMRNLKSEQKVSQMVGLVSSATSYHHGEQSLVQVIVSLAQDFVGTNNLNLLEPLGMFGTRLNGPSVHASERYIHTKLSPLVPYIFRKEDLGLLEPQLEEGHEIEPLMLLPIFPLVLVNGFLGIGTGWATSGPNFDVLKVVDHLVQLIKGNEPAPLAPSYRGFKGTIEYSDLRWSSKGVWQVHEDDDIDESLLVVEITELPVKVWTDDYISWLEDKARKKRISLKVFKCSDHDDQNVHLVLGLDRDKFPDEVPDNVLGRFLGLQKPLRSDMWLYTQAEADVAKIDLQKFEDASEIVKTFYRFRRPFYEKRKERMMQQINHQVQLLKNQVRCIKMFQDGSLSPEDLCESGLEEHGFDRMQSTFSPQKSDGFQYILRMSLGSLGRSGEGPKLKEKLIEVKKEQERLSHLDADEMWLEDLENFRAQYEKAQPPFAERQLKTSRLSREDRRKALREFNQERRRLSSNTLDLSLSTLERMTTPELHAIGQELCINMMNASSKQDYIDLLLLYSSIGFVTQNWEKLPMQDLQAHLRVRKLPQVGARAMLIIRLKSAQPVTVRFRAAKDDMKEALREMGVWAVGSVTELEHRFSVVRLRHIEEDQAVRNRIGEVKQLHDLAGHSRVRRRLVHCFARARCDDLPAARRGGLKKYRLKKEEQCWVESIKAKRIEYSVEGSIANAPPEFFETLATCFEVECGTRSGTRR